MKGIKLLLREKVTIIIAALLMLTLLACIPFVPLSAKYTTSTETGMFNLKLASEKAVLRTGDTNYGNYNRITFRQSLAELMVEKLGFPDNYEALDAITHINIVSTADLANIDEGTVLDLDSSQVTESGVVDIYWNNGTITISADGPIYASSLSQNLFSGSDSVQAGFSKLKTVNFSNLDTSATVKMNGLFMDCTDFEGFSFAGFDTSKCNEMSGMFKGCQKIKSVGGAGCDVDLTDINVSLVTSFENLFQNCVSLQSIDLSPITATSRLDNTSYMFDNCRSLTSLNLGNNFSTTYINKYTAMFRGCSSLTSLDVSGFNIATDRGVHMHEMFSGCSSLTSLDLSNFNTTTVALMNSMFNGCTNLQNINFGSNFTTAAVTNVSNMFSGCSNLTSLGTIQLNLSKIAREGFRSVFRNCSSLTEINFAQGFTKSVVFVDYAFAGCTGLTNHTLDFSSFDFSGVINYSTTFTGWLSGYDESSLIVIRPTAAGTWNSWLESPYNTSTGWPGVTFQ